MPKLVLLLVAAASLVLVSGAGAGTTTVCTGQYTNLVTDTLVVPAGATCDVRNATITGSVSVGAGATFYAPSSISLPVTIAGSVSVGAGATFFVPGRSSLHPATIGGSLQADHASLVYLNAVTIGKNLSVVGGDRVTLYVTSIGGNASVSGNAAVFPAALQVTGNSNFVGNTGIHFQQLGFFVGGNASFMGNDLIESFGGFRIEGNASFVDNGDVSLSFFVDLDGTHFGFLKVFGNLSCSGNTIGPLVAVPATIDGHASGQCEYLKP